MSFRKAALLTACVLGCLYLVLQERSQLSCGGGRLVQSQTVDTDSVRRDVQKSTITEVVKSFQEEQTKICKQPKHVPGSVDSKQALGDGCLHVFLDLGSNKGVHGRFLFEPELYPHQKVSKQHFDPVFGKGRHDLPICVFAFEPNPYHKPTQSKIEEAYKQMGWRYVYLQAGVSNVNGTLNFYRNGAVAAGNENEFWGFGTKQRVGDDTTNPPIPVQVVDFEAWFRFHVLGRCIPSGSVAPKVMMKMDIEGQEYLVLSSLMMKGLACKFDHVLMELHPDRMAGISEHSVENWFKAFNHMIGTSGCKPYIIFDEEAYVHDGQPLPVGT